MNKLHIRWCFLFFFIPVICFSQDDKTDSLKNVLKTLPDDTNKVNTLILLSRGYLDSSPKESDRYGYEAKELAEKINFQVGLGYALKNIGLNFYRQGKYIEALGLWEQSLHVFEKAEFKTGEANLLQNLGVIYFAQADDEKALEYYLRALKVGEEIGDMKRMAECQANIGAIYGKKSAKYDQALEYDAKALELNIKLDDQENIGTITSNMGEIYLLKGDDSTALIFFERSVNAYKIAESGNMPYSLNNLGRLYKKRKEYKRAIEYHKEAFDLAKKLESKVDMTQSLLRLADVYKDKGDINLAIQTYEQAKELAIGISANTELKDIYEGLSISYSENKDFNKAFKYQILLGNIKDVIYNIETDRKLGTLGFNYEIEKKQGQINLLNKDRDLQEANLQRQKVVKNVFIGGFTVVLLFAGVFLTQRNRITKEKKRSDELLLNILPEETAEELKATGKAKTKSFDMVTVMFTDFKNFTQASEKLTAEELVNEINHCYSEFDKIITSHGIEKIKTIGDAYMCAGGLPVSNQTHPVDVIKAGLEMQQFIRKNMEERKLKGQPFFELRLGIHTGPVVAGIVGIKKFAYDIWGDTVNTASRMESSGETGKVNISGTTFELVKNTFTCVHRGKIMAKNKGEIDMYFVEHLN